MTGKAARRLVIVATCEPSPGRDQELARWVNAGPDWNEVVALATAHGVLSYLAAAVRRAPWAALVPAGLRHLLRLHEAAAALAQVGCIDALRPLFDALRSRELDLLVLKGPALACSIYARPGLRGYRDIDLLCQARQLEETDAVLRAFGYVRHDPDEADQDGFHIVYEGARGALPIEVHIDPLQLGLPPRALDEFWTEAEPVRIGAVQCRMLGLHHQIVHLCVHMHTHGYGRLIWFKDLDLLIRQRGAEIDWEVVHALARAEGVGICVRHALALLGSLLGTPLPDAALAGGGREPLAELAHAVLWPRRKVLALASKQRLRALRFNARQGMLGVLPNLVVMGRRRDKLAYLFSDRSAAWSTRLAGLGDAPSHGGAQPAVAQTALAASAMRTGER